MSLGAFPEPYQSAFDLPTFKRLSTQLDQLRAVATFVHPDLLDTLQVLDAEHRALGDRVDQFYSKLGPLNWVYHDRLPAWVVDKALSEPDSRRAEVAFIDAHREKPWLQTQALDMSQQPELTKWRTLINRAIDDYFSGRYYAVAFCLIAVMDGLVNDIDKENRRGLHTRKPEEMTAWDSVTGHHLGLSAVLPVFLKTMRAPTSEPIYELHRHGIVHGIATNFDNATVATKAWDYLFAVVDWAGKYDTAEPESQTLADDLEHIRKTARHLEQQERLQSLWRASAIEPGHPHWTRDALRMTADGFFAAWSGRNFLAVGDTASKRHKAVDRNAHTRRTKAFFSPYRLTEYKLIRIDFTSSGTATVTVMVTVNERQSQVSMRWFCEGLDGGTVANGTPDSRWRRVLTQCPVG